MPCQLLHIPQRAPNGTDFLGGIRNEGSASATGQTGRFNGGLLLRLLHLKLACMQDEIGALIVFHLMVLVATDCAHISFGLGSQRAD